MGDDWFEYVDEPNGGQFDGENSNFGVVSVLDRPYSALVDRMTQVDAVAPDRVAVPGGRCLPWARSPAGVVSCTNRVPATALGPPGVPDGTGTWMAGPSGAVAPSGNAPAYGSAAHLHLDAPMVGMAASPDGGGYWLVAADGGVFAFGDAAFYGSAATAPATFPVVAIDGTAVGYRIVTSAGGVRSFGPLPTLSPAPSTGGGPVVGATS